MPVTTQGAATPPSRHVGEVMNRALFAWYRGWLAIDGPIGVHSRKQVAEVLVQLAVDGLLERDRRGRVRLPLTGRLRTPSRSAGSANSA
jgi:hypothetical protein